MNKKIIITCLSVFLTSWGFAQDGNTLVEDTIQAEAFDMPEGMLIGEDELMKESANVNNLTPGTGVGRTVSYGDSVLISRLSRIPTTIDLPLNEVTRKYIDTYSTRMKNSVAVMLGASNFYNPIFEEALERYGLPLELKYLPVIESALRPSATSRVGAAGLWQFMITTGKRYGLEVNTLVDERRDPIKSSEAAARYLRDLYQMFGDWGLAIAGYNCGEGNVQKALTRSGNQAGSADFWSVYNHLPKETRGYVPAFVAATYIMNYYCEHGIVPHEASLPLESDTVVVRHDVNFAQIASKCRVSIDELRAINPQYRRDVIPADYTLRLPAGSIEYFLASEDSIYGNVPQIAVLSTASSGVGSVVGAENMMVNLTSSVSGNTQTNTRQKTSRSTSSSKKQVAKKNVTVKQGDTLSAIASRNNTTVEQLRKLNPSIKKDRIFPDQSVRVK
ncbi:MAG: transglycosylase SLT domain-containing protein [Bacteroidales bacterium]|nr:transglycosylase SLT domain-containing protein [Bacteroidales bacterium]